MINISVLIFLFSSFDVHSHSSLRSTIRSLLKHYSFLISFNEQFVGTPTGHSWTSPPPNSFEYHPIIHSITQSNIQSIIQTIRHLIIWFDFRSINHAMAHFLIRSVNHSMNTIVFRFSNHCLTEPPSYKHMQSIIQSYNRLLNRPFNRLLKRFVIWLFDVTFLRITMRWLTS